MKFIAFILPLVLVIILASCGPNKGQLRSELRAVETEMMQITLVAKQQQARMSQAQYQAFIGSFAAGFGAVSGDYDLAGDGVDTAVESNRQVDVSSYSLDQLSRRYNALAQRRAEIVKLLR